MSYKQYFILLLLLLSNFVYSQDAEFIWSESTNNGSQINLSEYKHGHWQDGELVVEDNNWNVLPTIGANSQNHKIAVWSVINMIGEESSSLKYAIKNGQNWSKPKLLTNKMQTNLAPVVVFDNHDVCWVFWAANNGGDDDDIFVSRYKNNKWTQATKVNDVNTAPDILPEAGLDDSGNVWVSWQSLTSEGFVDQSKTYETQTMRKMLKGNSMSVLQIKAVKARSNLQNQMQPPKFFNSLGRASMHFPKDKNRPTKPIQGEF